MIEEIIKAVLLGVVEGVTEFLPISSTGHLILVNEWLHFDGPFTTMFDIVIQLGAILAVVVFFWKRLWQLSGGIWQKTIVGVLPALILGGLFGGFIEQKLFNPWVVALALIIGGLMLLYIEKKHNKPIFLAVADIPWSVVIGIGFIQCIAMIPGTSRSAATIIGALALGVSRVAAVEFSFFLAIPTMIAATAYSLLKHGAVMSGAQLGVLSIGFVTAFVVALFVIKFFIQYIQRHDFTAFVWYRIIVGIAIMLYAMMS